MKRYCDVCKADRDETQCPECMEPTRPVETAEQPLPDAADSAATRSRPAARAQPRASRPAIVAPSARASRPKPAPDRSSLPAKGAAAKPMVDPPSDVRDGSTIIPKARQSELEQYISDGYEVFLIAGTAGSGKSELLSAYQQDAYLRQIRKDTDGHVLPTVPNRLDCVTVPVRGRKVVFVDASGENFRQLHPLQRMDGKVPEKAVEFLRLVSSRLAGVVLLLSLDDLWAEAGTTAPGQREQIEILNWVVMLLRWLQEDGAYPGGEISFQQHVNRQVQRQRRRLKVPVLSLFSRADVLHDLLVPSPAAGAGWLPSQGAERRLEPVGEDPLLLAHNRLPNLIAALRTHVDHFRIDFVHSLYEDRDTGAIVNDGGCGLSSSLAWLLDDAWRSRLPSIPTCWWLDTQRFVDERLLRRDRWRRLPAPRPLQ